MAEICKAITLKVNVPPPITLVVNFKGEFLSSSDGEDYKRGYDDGHAQGLLDGQANGFDKGYSQGLKDGTKEEQEKYVKITENGTTEIVPDENKVLSKVTVEVDVADSFYDDFWDAYQENGARTNYSSAFKNHWNDNNFKPKYDIVPTTAGEMFVGFKGHDMSALLKECNVVLDFSKCTSFLYIFANNWNITKLPVIDCSSATQLHTTFYNCGSLHTIEKIIVTRNLTDYGIAFLQCPALKEIRFEGEIAANINFASSSKLSMDSVDSIGTCCIDLTGQDSKTVTFHKDVIAKMSDEQKAVFTNKNWTIASST